MTQVTVIGVGAIGGFFAAHAVANGHDVICAVRRPFEELVLETVDGPDLRSRPTVRTDPADAEPSPWVLLATKAHQVDGAADWLRACVGPDTVVVALQNGVEHVERLAPYVGAARVLPAVVYCGAELLAPGHVQHRTNGFLTVPDGPESEALAALYKGSGAGVRRTADFPRVVWQKLMANVVANGITALTDQGMPVFRHPDVGALAVAIAREVAAVAAAEGAEIDEGYPELLAGGIAAMPDDAGTSMLYDRRARRPLEHDALYGAVHRAARRHGLDTPRLDTLRALLIGASDPPPGPTAG